jgi:hypothetical protein
LVLRFGPTHGMASGARIPYRRGTGDEAE